MLISRTNRRLRTGFLTGLALFVATMALGALASTAMAASPAPIRLYHLSSLRWVRVGATVDPTRGQAPYYSDHGGMSFAELLEAGANAGMRPDLTQVLGLPRTRYGMPMETAILIRLPGSSRIFEIWKNDVGSGQRGDPYYKIDLHPGIARALGVDPRRFKGTVEVAAVPVAGATRARRH